MAKKLVWDWKHRSVQTDRSGSPLVDFLGPAIEPHATLLDLGCDAGNLLGGLRLAGWKGHYIGVDISQREIAEARKMNDPKADWVVSAIEDYPVDQDFDLICLVESLYYVRLDRVPQVLHSLRSRSKAVYIRIWDLRTPAPFIQQLGPYESPRPDIFVLTHLDA